MSLLQNSNAISAGGYTVDNSVRLRSSASAYLSRTPSSAGNRKTFTVSFWFKRGTLSVDQKFLSAYSADSDNGNMDFRLTSGNILYWGPWNTGITTTAVFRDPSAWYHIVLAIDTTQATGANRHRVYVNGVEYTFSGTPVTQNTDLAWNNNVAQNIGRNARTSADYLDGYFADFYNIDGQALTPSSFGETDATTGVWKPKAYTGTYGTNGFYLKFSDIATTSGSNAGLGKDFSGNSNYWTTNNISVTSGTTYDAMIDSPTNASSGTQPVGNYAVLNPLSGGLTPSQGNLAIVQGSAAWNTTGSTILPTTGKWYFEGFMGTIGSANYIGIGLRIAGQLSSGEYAGSIANSWGFIANNTAYNTYTNATAINTGSYTATTATAYQVAVDFDAGKIWFGYNNTWVASGNPSTGANPTYTFTANTQLQPILSAYSNTNYINFGQRPFAYTPPTGYQALCTTNLS